MPNEFAITTQTQDTLVLDRRNQGEAVFTVANESGRPMYTRARVVPVEPEITGWFSLGDLEERHFNIADVEDYAIQINAPEDAIVGRYSFQLELIDIRNPDQQLAISADAVTIEVQKPPRRLRLPRLQIAPQQIPLVIGALVVIIALVIVGVLVFRQRAIAPELPRRDSFALGAEISPAFWIFSASAVAARSPGEETSRIPTPVLNYSVSLNQDAGIDYLTDLGATWIALEMNNERDWATMARRIAILHEQNFKVLVRVSNIGFDSPDVMYHLMPSYAATIAGADADAIEFLPNQNVITPDSRSVYDPETYTSLLKQVYQAVKAVNPDVLVISGAPLPTNDFAGYCTTLGCDDDVYIERMATAGAEDYMDCVGLQYLIGTVNPDAESGDSRESSDYSSHIYYFPQLVERYASTFTDTPLCITALGYAIPGRTEARDEGSAIIKDVEIPLPEQYTRRNINENPVTPRLQATWLAQAVARARVDDRIQVVVIREFGGQGAPANSPYSITVGPNCAACTRLNVAMR